MILKNCNYKRELIASNIKQIKSDILVEFLEAKISRGFEDITEEEYHEILTAIQYKAMSRGKEAVTALLEEAYNAAEDITMKNEALMSLLDTGVKSLKDFIEKFPIEAFENEVLELSGYRYEDLENYPANFISMRYFKSFFLFGEELLEFVNLLSGDTKKISQAFDKAKDIIKGHL